MANMDKLILWGAAVVMAAVGSLSIWKISHEPTIDPAIARLEKELLQLANSSEIKTPPPPMPSTRNRKRCWLTISPGANHIRGTDASSSSSWRWSCGR